MIDRTDFWVTVLLLGAVTYALRLSFLAWTQNRPLPDAAKRLLDFVPVTVLPALVAPLIFFPEATGGAPDPARLLAASAAIAVGVMTRSVIAVIVAGMVCLWTLQTFIG